LGERGATPKKKERWRSILYLLKMEKKKESRRKASHLYGETTPEKRSKKKEKELIHYFARGIREKTYKGELLSGEEKRQDVAKGEKESIKSVPQLRKGEKRDQKKVPGRGGLVKLMKRFGRGKIK